MNNHNLAAGTPRGFNLANMPMMPNFAPGFAPPAAFASPFPNFGPHAVTAPTGFMPGMTMPLTGEDGMHQVGPMRRGGGRFTGQRQGPYDRRQNQNPRYSSIGGRLTPPRNGMAMGGRMMGSGASKWGDGAGAQTVGPKEAVQGRQLKSYEDLDAVSGGAGGELNY